MVFNQLVSQPLQRYIKLFIIEQGFQNSPGFDSKNKQTILILRISTGKMFFYLYSANRNSLFSQAGTVFTMMNDFFESYANALEKGDIKLIVSHFYIPCTIVSDDSSTTFSESSRLEGLLGHALRFFKQLGITHIRTEVWTRHAWTDKIISVKVNWKYFDGLNQPVYNYDYQYVLKTDKNNKWKIILAVSLNEKERVEELMKNKKIKL
jgi:hypothetical protein